MLKEVNALLKSHNIFNGFWFRSIIRT